MEKWKVMAIMLLSVILTGYAAAESLAYEDFESYSSDDDLWINWTTAGAGNPFLTPYLDSTIKYEGNNSVRLDAPLMDYNETTETYFVSTDNWGVIIRDDGTSTDASAYNIMTLMVRTDSTSSVSDVDIVVRDVYGYNVGESGSVSVPNDGNWYKVRVILNGEGDKTELEMILPFFNIESGAVSGVSQLWIDDIVLDHILAADEILQADVNGLFGKAGGTVNYLFVMTQQPPADVNFILYPPETLDFGAGYGSPVQITFTSSNWNVAQAMNINISSLAVGAQTVDVNVSSTDPNYNAALSGSLNIQVLGEYGAPYVISSDTPVWADIPDDTGIDLSNGVIGEIWQSDEGMLTDADWVEWAPDQDGNPAYAEIVFDLGTAKDVNSVDICHSAIDYYPPGTFELSYSTDGSTYTTATAYTPYTLSNIRAKTRIDVHPAVNARYVKLKVRCVDDDAANWFFLSEVQFNAPKVTTYPTYTYDANTVPEDTNCPDPYMTKLMNGAVDYYTSSSSFQYLDWVWFRDANSVAYDNVIIYADYGSVKEFSNLSLNYATSMSTTAANKVWAPSYVYLSFSDDGVTYGTPISLTGWYQGTGTSSTITGKTDSKSFTAQTGRYVKIQIARNTANTVCMRFGEIILSNRTQMTYVLSTTTPVWGSATDQPGDPAYGGTSGPLKNLNFGDLADGYVPTQVGPYNDSDWVEWAPDQVSGQPTYGLITFDLKSVQKVRNVAIAYSSDYADMPAPDALEVAFSTDGTTYSTMADTGAVFSNDMNSPQIFNTVFDLPDTDAQYVQLKIHCRDDNGSNWIFISEVKFNVFTADLNDDGVVNYKDLDMMADQWLQSGSGLSADIAGDDGQVNFLDFAEFAMEWME